jgi:hypothetical protein
MIYDFTELKTTDDDSVSIAELIAFFKKNTNFTQLILALEEILNLKKSIEELTSKTDENYEELEEVEEYQEELKKQQDAFKLELDKKLETLPDNLIIEGDKRLVDARRPLAHIHKIEEIEGLKEALNKKIKEVVIEKVKEVVTYDNAELTEIKKQNKEIISVIDDVISKAEQDLIKVVNELSKKFEKKIRETKKGIQIIGGPSAQQLIEVKDEGVTLTGALTSLNFTGSAVTATNSGGAVTVNITGGGGTPGGSNTEVQFNDSGSFGGDSGFTYNKTTDVLTVAGEVVTNGIQASTSGGGHLQTNGGSDALLWGAGGSSNGTLYGGWNYNNGTANTLVSLGASKTFTSLDTTTYPSLTEISYVKGVTSAIQTQINGKQATITTGTSAQYFAGDLSLVTFPTNVSSFSNDAGYIASALSDPNLTITGDGLTGTELKYNEVVVIVNTSTVVLTDADIYKVFTTDGSTNFTFDYSAISLPDFTFKVFVDTRNFAEITIPIFNELWIGNYNYTTGILSSDKGASATVRIAGSRTSINNICGNWKGF